MSTNVTDFLVETKNPELLDATLHQMPMLAACVVGIGTPDGPLMHDGYSVVRVFGDAGFFLFAMEKQGYCRIIAQLPDLL